MNPFPPCRSVARFVGAPGTVAGVAESREAAPCPALLWPRTSKVYEVPLLSPLTVVSRALPPPGTAVQPEPAPRMSWRSTEAPRPSAAPQERATCTLPRTASKPGGALGVFDGTVPVDRTARGTHWRRSPRAAHLDPALTGQVDIAPLLVLEPHLEHDPGPLDSKQTGIESLEVVHGRPSPMGWQGTARLGPHDATTSWGSPTLNAHEPSSSVP